MSIYIYIYIYISTFISTFISAHTPAQTHTYIYMKYAGLFYKHEIVDVVIFFPTREDTLLRLITQ